MEKERSERRRGWRTAAVRCALVLGVCALLVSLVALTLMLTRRPEPEPPKSLRSQGQECWPETQTCARLVYNGSPKIENRTLKWYTSCDIEGVLFGQEFHYDEDSAMLKIKSEGMYCISAQMTTKQKVNTDSEEQGNATLTIHHKTINNSNSILSLSVHLNPRSAATLSQSMAVSFPLKANDLLHVTLTASSSSGSTFLKWQLENPIFSVSRISGNPMSSQGPENNDFCYDAMKMCS